MTSDLPPAPGNLPAEPNSFVGRERDLAELVAILGRGRVLTLCGPGGIGKTRLALRLAAMLPERFPDGAWIVDLADADLDEAPVPASAAEVRAADEGSEAAETGQVIGLVTAALGIRAEASRRLADTLAEALQPRAMLLILDTCERMVAECAELVQRLLATCPGLHVIATSREPLGVRGEIIWRVPPLGLPLSPVGEDPSPVMQSEAVQLFVERAAAVRPGFELTDGNAAVGRRHLPHARWCAAGDRAGGGASPRALHRPDQPNGWRTNSSCWRSATGPPRRASRPCGPRWSGATSCSIPPSDCCSAGCRCSTAGTWTWPSACALTALCPPCQVLDQLRALIDKSLVSVDGELNGDARYRLLDTVRELAAEQAAAAGEMAGLRAAHRDCMLSIAEEIASVAYVRGEPSWPERVALYHRARADRTNFNLALACCVQRGDAEEGLRICYALSGYWLASGEVAEGAGWLDRLLAIDVPAPAAVPPGVRAKALAMRSELAFEQLDYAASATFARECLELSKPIKDGNPAAALRLLALTDLMSGRMDEALGHADAAVVAAKEMTDDWEEGVAIAVRAAVIAAHGDLTAAEKAFRQALDVLRDNNGWGVANVLYGLGQIARARRDPDAAAQYFGDALSLYRQIDARPEMARCLAGIGRIALA